MNNYKCLTLFGLAIGMFLITGCSDLLKMTGVEKLESLQMEGFAQSKFSEAFLIDRPKIGLPELPTSGQAKVFYLTESLADDYKYDVRIELSDTPNFKHVNRELIFIKNGESFKYIGEKVVGYGPGVFGNKENQFQENIMIRYSIRKTWEDNFEGYKIKYSGNDRSLKDGKIEPNRALEIIEKWKAIN